LVIYFITGLFWGLTLGLDPASAKEMMAAEKFFPESVKSKLCQKFEGVSKGIL